MTTPAPDQTSDPAPAPNPAPETAPTQNAAAGVKEATVWLYKKHKKVYPRSVKGVFDRWRWILVWATQLFFLGMPWLQWSGRQAVLLHFASRRFYIFGLVLYPQDVIYLTGILILSALSLFLFTAVAGRQWCGYACPQTVYTEIFLWIERKLEGDRSARMRLDAGPMTAQRLWRGTAKQVVWIAFSLWTGFSFVGWFTPIRDLAVNAAQFSLGPAETFWLLFYGLFTYGFAGFMREQVCLYMCPYARFQSAMFDKDTLIVTYDTQRGEPRGSRSRQADYKAKGLGDCINCTMCVQVCPTGIDIRNGLQYECISCAACIDVCDEIMDKVGYPRGLIRYSTERAMEQGWDSRQIWRHVFRPRVLIYITIMSLVIIAFVTSLILRSPFKVDVVRDRAALARYTDDNKIENVYRLNIMNASERTQTYTITADGLPGIQTTVDVKDHDKDKKKKHHHDGKKEDDGHDDDPRDGQARPVIIEAARNQWVTVTLDVPPIAGKKGSQRIYFDILESDGRKVREKAVFYLP